jgi:uncharacterized protein (TIGR03083 family)
VLGTPTVAATLSGLAAHRMVFGINSLLVLVIVRHTDTHEVAGLGTAVVFVAATGLGSFLANIVTPPAVKRWGRYATANGALVCAAFIQVAGATLQLAVMVACGFLLGLAGQVVKLCADTAMQLDVDDALRGHVFAVQDSLFWLSFIAATTFSAAVLPADGHAPILALSGSLIYLGGLATHASARSPAPARQLGCGHDRRRADRRRPARRERRPRRAGRRFPPSSGASPPRPPAGPSPTRSPTCCGPTGGVDVHHRRGRVRPAADHGNGRSRGLRRPGRRGAGRDTPPQLLADWRTTRAGLHAALRTVPAGRKLLWFGPPMSAMSMATARLMETWAHGLDVADALGVRVPPSPRLRSIAHLGVRTRDFAFTVHGLTPPAEPFLVELTAPGGDVWSWGPRTRRSGSPARPWTSVIWSPSGGPGPNWT